MLRAERYISCPISHGEPTALLLLAMTDRSSPTLSASCDLTDKLLSHLSAAQVSLSSLDF